jgi:hypothetical protein
MDAFRKTISRRLWTGRIFVLLVLVLNIAQRFIDFESVVPDNIFAFSLGVTLGAEFLGILLLAKYSKAMREEEKLKELYIAETDERNMMIRTKTGGVAINIIMGVLVCAILVAGVWSEVVFYTLFATLLFVALLKGTLKLYYKKKL